MEWKHLVTNLKYLSTGYNYIVAYIHLFFFYSGYDGLLQEFKN